MPCVIHSCCDLLLRPLYLSVASSSHCGGAAARRHPATSMKVAVLAASLALTVMLQVLSPAAAYPTSDEWNRDAPPNFGQKHTLEGLSLAQKMVLLSNFLKSQHDMGVLSSSSAAAVAGARLSPFAGRHRQMAAGEDLGEEETLREEDAARLEEALGGGGGGGGALVGKNKRGPNNCINSCLNGGSMSFIRCKSMCHW